MSIETIKVLDAESPQFAVDLTTIFLVGSEGTLYEVRPAHVIVKVDGRRWGNVIAAEIDEAAGTAALTLRTGRYPEVLAEQIDSATGRDVAVTIDLDRGAAGDGTVLRSYIVDGVRLAPVSGQLPQLFTVRFARAA